MIVDYRCYTLVPGTVNQYLDCFEKDGLDVQKEILGSFIGMFRTEFGTVNQIVHLWGFENALDRQIRRDKLVQDPRFHDYVAKQRGLIVSQEVRMLLPTEFSPILAMANTA